MKYVVDAQLSFRLAKLLSELGYDTLHTDDMPQAEFTPDEDIRKLAHREDRIVITKDSDFLDSFVIRKSPRKLLLIATGNASNAVIFKLFHQHIHTIDAAFQTHSLIELSLEALIIHE